MLAVLIKAGVIAATVLLVGAAEREYCAAEGAGSLEPAGSCEARRVTKADYVVVGGGTAGCALAARLCEGLPQAQVVLLERAFPRKPEQENIVRPIRRMLGNLGDPEVVEAWPSEPNAGLDNRSVEVIAGRTLGGSSAINGAQFSRPEAKVPASWGLPGLDEATAERLYNKVKAQTIAGPPPEDLRAPYSQEWIQANVLAGNPVVENPKGEPVDAVWDSLTMSDDRGRRYDSAYAYLRPALNGVCSGNLDVIQGATVSKVLLAGSTAVGVEYLVNAESATLSASKEVVLSAGAFATPKILMLSGIGPAEMLADFGIPLLADLPVGQQAHARGVGMFVYTYTGRPVPPESNFSVLASEEAQAAFDAGQGGPLASNTASVNGVYGPPVGAWRSGTMIPFFGFPFPENSGSSVCILNTDKRSRATVKLNSTDIHAPPAVDTNILAQQEEVDRMVMCWERERKYLKHLGELGFNMTEVAPGSLPLNDAARKTTANSWHFVGSCGIGRVLDKELKVKGFDNLRVVDASAIPNMTENSGPAGTTYMLAEYAAEVLIAEGSS